MNTRRSGITHVESLIVIGIVITLLAVVIPAVQHVRQSARHVTCQNNLRQIVPGIANHESARAALPSSSDRSVSRCVQIGLSLWAEGNMIPVGYLAKHVNNRTEWLNAAGVENVYSVSGCVSKDFTDYINFWKHNGYWFFDSPKVIQDIAERNGIDLAGTTLFFYEAYELEFDDSVDQWKTVIPEPSFPTRIDLPYWKALEGYDVVTYSCGTTAECSPLSCNSLATRLETNQHCLVASFERAKQLIEEGKFHNSEPGPFRILAVYSTKWPDQKF